jgi:cytochrome P450
MANFTHRIINAGVMLSVLPTWLGDFVVRRFLSVEPEMDLIMKLIMPELEKIRERGYEEETTFISMVLNLKKEDGSPRTIQESAFYFNQIALASIHTTSHITSFTLHELACRPDIVNELRAELVQLGDNRNPETDGELPLMDSFLREVLRWNVDHLGMHHLCIKDTVLSTGHFIPKDTLIVAAVIQKHRNAIYDESGREIKFDKPLTEFDAHRFVGKDMMRASAVDSDYVAFGLGAHACPGRYFAVNEIKYVVSELITRYNITTESGNRASDNVALGMTIFPPKEPLLFEGR